MDLKKKTREKIIIEKNEKQNKKKIVLKYEFIQNLDFNL